jgi:hypothetical protein
MRRARCELVASAATLAMVLATALRADPLRMAHPRNLYEAHVDLSEDEVCSIQAHLEHVVGILRARSTEGLSSELMGVRLRNLEKLREYAAQGVFPRNRRFRGDLVPHFIDGGGRACAVAHLMIESGAASVAREIARTANFAFLPNIDDVEAERWIEESGLTPEECAMIQPGYGRSWPARFIEIGLDREGATRPGPIRVTINQYDTVGLGRPSHYVETIKGFVDSGRIRASGADTIEDLPLEGVTIRWPANDADIGRLWRVEYDIDVDSGSYTFEGAMHYGSTPSAPRIPTTGDTSVDVAPVPAVLALTGGPLESARSIGPDCPGSTVEETAPGSYLLRAHGIPMVTDQSTFEFQSDGLLFAYKEVWGDFQLTATLPAEDMAKAALGLMVRKGLDRRSPYVFLERSASELTVLTRSHHPEYFTEYHSPVRDPEEIHEVRDPRLSGGAFRTLRIERRDYTIVASVLDETGITGEPGAWIEIENPYGNYGQGYRLLVGVAATSEQGCTLTAAAFTDVLLEEGPPPEIFHRGDVEPDGTIGISDAIRTLGFLFLGDASPPCSDAADWNDDGKLDLSDPVGTLGWLFLGDRGQAYLGCWVDRNPEEPPLPACIYPLEACR